MTLAPIVLCLVVYLFMGALPVAFFKREGRALNLRWWLTASPFVVAPLALVAGATGVLPALVAGRAAELCGVAGTLVAALALALLAATWATHRIPLALWHQENDAPRAIVTWGPYRMVRHPFYASFVLLLVASVLVTPNLATLVLLVGGVAVLGWTARGEEQRLLRSPLGAEYAAYLARTGRFLPRLWSAA
jgi:protein-S-isoprenylcysteine O-methyltransferase Ste14